jgi:hypothetical protein
MSFAAQKSHHGAFRAYKSRYGDCRASATACGSKVLGEMEQPIIDVVGREKGYPQDALFRA